jgi:hypothetical protein
MEQDNRESWPNRMANGMAPLFEALDAPCPPACVSRSASPVAVPRTRRLARAGTIGAVAAGISARRFARIDHEPMRHNPLNADRDAEMGAVG